MSPTKINQLVRDEISRIAEIHDINADILEDFAHFVIKNHINKDTKPKPLTLTQLKEAIYKR